MHVVNITVLADVVIFAHCTLVAIADDREHLAAIALDAIVYRLIAVTIVLPLTFDWSSYRFVLQLQIITVLRPHSVSI